MVFRRGGIARRVTALAVACFAAPLAAVAQAPLLVHAGATVSVVSSSRWGPDQSRIPQYHLVGEVANSGDTSSKPYNATDIRVRATDPLGNPVDTVDTAAITLGPGQRSPFDIATASPCTGCTLSVTFAPTADPANRRFSITPDPLTVTTDPDGTQHFSGTVTNHNTIAAGDVHVTLTFYSGANGTGIVVDQDQIPLNNNATSTLNSGDSADFDISRSPEHPAYGSFAVFAESSSAPSLPVLTPSPLPFDIGNVHVGSSATQSPDGYQQRERRPAYRLPQPERRQRERLQPGEWPGRLHRNRPGALRQLHRRREPDAHRHRGAQRGAQRGRRHGEQSGCDPAAGHRPGP